MRRGEKSVEKKRGCSVVVGCSVGGGCEAEQSFCEARTIYPPFLLLPSFFAYAFFCGSGEGKGEGGKGRERIN